MPKSKEDKKENALVKEAKYVLESMKLDGFVDSMELSKTKEFFDNTNVDTVFVSFDTDTIKEDETVKELCERIGISKEDLICGLFHSQWGNKKYAKRYKNKPTTWVRTKVFVDDNGEVEASVLQFLQSPASHAKR